MQLIRVSPVVLALASMVLLGACSDSPSTSSAPPAPATATGASPAPNRAGDAKLCSAVQKIGQDLKDELVGISQSGKEPTRDLFTGILQKMAEKVTAEAFAAGDSAVAVAARQLGEQASQAAKEQDPVAAASSPGFEKAGSDLTAACQAAGVAVTF
ncbi:hypothetical protein [Actinoplanes sp. TFC3]|uniref:hypothetical protein n=1 Tax=Actinoplanes sp. TFC3 TaxID=1710355 RepID=UPI000829E4E1|nr:hypothetical protein [Actinoplanes sp. TFC3]